MSRNGGANSTRLSLDIADLPITPFGMGPRSPPRKHTPNKRINKLSLKSQQMKTGKPPQVSVSKNKENENKSSRPLFQQEYSRSTDLETLNEEPSIDHERECSNDENEEPRTDFIPRLHSRPPLKENTGNRHKFPHLFRRQSTYTDVDDGSFVEFCQGKEEGHRITSGDKNQPLPGDKAFPLLYYTCESQNETQFSTSTKTNNAAVGFRKFLDTFKKQKDMRNITGNTEEARSQKKIDFDCDESIIACSANVVNQLKPRKHIQAANSTAIGRLPCDGSNVAPLIVPDISTLTIQSEVTDSSNSSPTTPQHRNRPTDNHSNSVVAIPDTSEEEDFCVSPGNNLTAFRRPSENLHNPVVFVEHHKQNEGHPVRQETGEKSLISEDVSIVSSLPPSNEVQDPVEVEKGLEIRPNNCPEGKAIYVAISEEEDDQIVYEYEDEPNEVVQEKSKVQTLETSKNPCVAKWIMTSPFKDSSFDTSFLARDEDTSFSETPSQPKARGNTDAPESSKRSTKLTRRRSSCSVQRNMKTAAYVSATSSDESEKLLGKRSGKPSQVFHSTSEDSDDGFISSVVRRQRRLRQRLLGTEARGNYIVESSESSCEESLHLRLSEEPSRAVSQRSTKVIGKSAASNYNTEKSPLVLPKSSDSEKIIESQIHAPVTRISSSDSECEDEKIIKSQTHAPVRRISSSDSECEDSVYQNHEMDDSLPDVALSPGTPHVEKKLHFSSSGSTSNENPVSEDRRKDKDVKIEEWRQNKTSVLHTFPKISKPENRHVGSTIMQEKKMKIQKHLDFLTDDESEEDSILYQVEETSESEDNDREPSDNENEADSEESDMEYSNSKKEEKSHDTSGSDDSFEEYLKRVKKIAEERKKKKECVPVGRDDKYESSFINDGSSSEDDESFSLPPPHFPHRPQQHHRGSIFDDLRIPDVGKGKSKYPKTEKLGGSRTGGSIFDDLIKSDAGKGERKDPKTGKLGGSWTGGGIFDDLIKSDAGKGESKDPKTGKLGGSRTGGSIFDDLIKSDARKGESKDPKTGKLEGSQTGGKRKGERDPKNGKGGTLTTDKGESGESNARKGGSPTKTKGATKNNLPTSTWRATPVVVLDSDSDSDEDVFPITPYKKTIPPPKTPKFTILRTPKPTKPGKVYPKTEGHHRPISKTYGKGSINTTPTLSFLASLSSNVNMMRCHPDAVTYTKNFKRKRVELAEKLLKYYNTHVFEHKLPATMNIKWNNRMTKTAGFCYYQIDRTQPSGRGSRIELSTKVIDAPERLRDTLIHELCHSASWIISGYKDGHGPLWKAWASKAEKTFPELPAITRCHSYDIQCRYTYRCTRCSYSIGRHSKSLDTKKKVCGRCYGTFELIDNINTPASARHTGTLSAASTGPPKTPKTTGAFALFVKENYGTVKRSGTTMKHGDVMKVLSAQFSKMKTSGTAG